MKKIKSLVAMAAASMLLCGFMCQAAEGSNEKADSTAHVHEYFIESSSCTGSNTLYQHQYLYGTVHNISGKDEDIYATCYVVLFSYRDLYRCNHNQCEDYVYRSHTEEKHMNCGQ